MNTVTAPGVETSDAQRHLADKARALFNLRFTADRVSLVNTAVQAVIDANLAANGFKDVLLSVQSAFSDMYSYGGLGVIRCTASFKSQLPEGMRTMALQTVLAGLPVNYIGQPALRMGDIRGEVSFVLNLDQEGCELAVFRAAAEQEHALLKALVQVRKELQDRGMQDVMQGDNAQSTVLRREKKVASELEELTRQLEAKRAELAEAVQAADAVRKELREAPNPAADTLLAQVNTLRERLGITPL